MGEESPQTNNQQHEDTMNIDDLTIKQVREIARAFPMHQIPPTPLAMLEVTEDEDRLAPDGEIRIAVLQRGHVVVGKYSQTGSIGRMDNAMVIRKWGTSNGLGELAERGPLPESATNGPTRMDKCPPVQFHAREVIFLMEVNADAWRSYCN